MATTQTFTPSLPFGLLCALADQVVRLGYAELPDTPALMPDDVIVLNLLVQAAEQHLN